MRSALLVSTALSLALVAGWSGLGRAQAHARVRVFHVPDIVVPPSHDVVIDLLGFRPPRDGARFVYLDAHGELGRGRTHDAGASEDCDLCGGMRGYVSLLLDAAPTRPPAPDFEHHLMPVAVGPLADDAPSPRLIVESDPSVGWSVDLDGDGRGDLARHHIPRPCSGPAHRIARSHSGCDLMERAVCDAQVSRGPHGPSWRPFERVEHAVCMMDGQMDREF